MEGPRVTHAARHAKALAERDADALWESSQEWVALGDQIAAAAREYRERRERERRR